MFALFFEANGLAAAGRSPYATLVPATGRDVDRTGRRRFLQGTDDERRIEAETAIAVLDGLLLPPSARRPGAAERAARRLGLRAG